MFFLLWTWAFSTNYVKCFASQVCRWTIIYFLRPNVSTHSSSSEAWKRFVVLNLWLTPSNVSSNCASSRFPVKRTTTEISSDSERTHPQSTVLRNGPLVMWPSLRTNGSHQTPASNPWSTITARITIRRAKIHSLWINTHFCCSFLDSWQKSRTLRALF